MSTRELEAECARLRTHLRQALRQWKMYAELEEDVDLARDISPEASLYRKALEVADNSLVAESGRRNR